MVSKATFWGGLALLGAGVALLGVAAFFYLGGFLFYWIAEFEQSSKPVLHSMDQQTSDMRSFGFYVALPAIALLIIGAASSGLGFVRRRSEMLPTSVPVSRPPTSRSNNPRNRRR